MYVPPLCLFSKTISYPCNCFLISSGNTSLKLINFKLNLIVFPIEEEEAVLVSNPPIITELLLKTEVASILSKDGNL